MNKQSAVQSAWDVDAIRRDFPILKQTIHDHPLVYLDNAATTQKPQVVIDAMSHYYETCNANVHRGLHGLSARATKAFEAVREKVCRFIHAPASKECIFVRGATEAINLVAHSFVAPMIETGDEIVITHMEHHANIVPWQLICQRVGAVLKIAPISITGEVLLDKFEQLITDKTKFVSISYASNVLGTINPVAQMIKIAHAKGAYVLVDGTQASPHLPVDVQALECDFYVFSSHKMYGPTGVGVLWGRAELLERMIPYQTGGEMITHVSFENTEFAPIPYKFEAGTPNVAGVIGFGAALDYLWSIGLEKIAEHEAHLLAYATDALLQTREFNIIGTASAKVPLISFVHGTIHSHDIGTILDHQGIAIRSGHHCAMPLMDFYQVSATSRISFALYNTTQEIDTLMEVLRRVKEIFA